MSAGRRPWRHRFWFTKPQWHWLGLATLAPVRIDGGDEFDWHVWTLGWTITGRIHVATRPCPGTGKCAEFAEEVGLTHWPVDVFGNNHLAAADDAEVAG